MCMNSNYKPIKKNIREMKESSPCNSEEQKHSSNESSALVGSSRGLESRNRRNEGRHFSNSGLLGQNRGGCSNWGGGGHCLGLLGWVGCRGWRG